MYRTQVEQYKHINTLSIVHLLLLMKPKISGNDFSTAPILSSIKIALAIPREKMGIFRDDAAKKMRAESLLKSCQLYKKVLSILDWEPLTAFMLCESQKQTKWTNVVPFGYTANTLVPIFLLQREHMLSPLTFTTAFLIL